MIFDWYRLFNKQSFLDTQLVSRKLSVFLSGQGFREILITRGVDIGITYEGVFLSLSINDRNPFIFEDLAVFEDDDGDVWLGVKAEDED